MPLIERPRFVRSVASWSDRSADSDGVVRRAAARALATTSVHALRPRRPLVFGGAIASAAALVGVLWLGRAAPERLAARGATWPELVARVTYLVGGGSSGTESGGWLGGARAVPLVFSDGTAIELRPGARARVTATRPNGASVLVERGTIDARFAHHPGGADWRVQAGPFEIRIVGTALVATWEDGSERLQVEVTEGRVEIVGPHGHAVVSAGEQVELAADEDDPSASASAPAAGGDDKRVAARAPRTPTPVWRRLLKDGERCAALRALESDGADAMSRIPSADELLAIADAARHCGQPARAREAILLARARGARGRPTFVLGKVAADQLHQPQEALRWFEAYLEETKAGELAEEARGRIIELRRKTGDREGARRAAREYAERHPSGAYIALARAMLAP